MKRRRAGTAGEAAEWKSGWSSEANQRGLHTQTQHWIYASKAESAQNTPLFGNRTFRSFSNESGGSLPPQTKQREGPTFGRPKSLYFALRRRTPSAKYAITPPAKASPATAIDGSNSGAAGTGQIGTPP